MREYSLHDFINIPYKWGGTHPEEGLDCLGLHNYICATHDSRVLTGYKWVIDTYSCDAEMPPKFIRKLSSELFKEPSKKKGAHLDFLLIDWFGRDGVGTVYEQGGEKFIIYTGVSGSHFSTYQRAITRIRGIWDTKPYSTPIDINNYNFNYHDLPK